MNGRMKMKWNVMKRTKAYYRKHPRNGLITSTTIPAIAQWILFVIWHNAGLKILWIFISFLFCPPLNSIGRTTTTTTQKLNRRDEAISNVCSFWSFLTPLLTNFKVFVQQQQHLDLQQRNKKLERKTSNTKKQVRNFLARIFQKNNKK